jgi:peptidoglycan/LPS O-acetylase OafA/YrhL
MKVYFPNLDGLRFTAAFLVVLEHASGYLSSAVPAYSSHTRPHLVEAGRYGVTLFFVLSGFLITYLLMAEQQKTATIDIKKFYIRRMLRIWPLYFAFGLISIFTTDAVLAHFGIPVHTPKMTNLLYLLTFTINFQLIFGASNRGIVALLWSVCVEEQFYAAWPWAVRRGAKQIRSVIIGFIAIGIVSTGIMHLLVVSGHINGQMNPIYIFPLCRFGHFGIGALGAYLLSNKEKFPRFYLLTRNRWIQAAVILLAFMVSFQIILMPAFVDAYFLDMVPALLFGYIILAAVSGNFLVNMEVPLLKRMGTYSYGIYVLHTTVAQLCVGIFKRYIPAGFLTYEVFYPLFVTAAVVLVAGLSYELYEKRFLQIKKKYTIIQNHPV